MLESVLADRNPGWVFADHEEQPTAAVVVSRSSFTHVGGGPDREFLDFALASSAPAGEPLVISSATLPPALIEGGRTIDRIEFSRLEPTWKALLRLPEGMAATKPRHGWRGCWGKGASDRTGSGSRARGA